MKEDDEQEDTMNCGLSVTERDVLQAMLGGHEDTVPPHEVWQRISTQARAEGLFKRRFAEGTKWLAGSGIAAAVVMTVLNVPTTLTVSNEPNPEFDDTPPIVDRNSNIPTNLSTLMVQSRQLERDLRRLPGQPSLMRASTAATIAELEDRIAAIDYRLNHPDIRLNPIQVEIYWRERVRLMNSLLNIRRAQAQRMVF